MAIDTWTVRRALGHAALVPLDAQVLLAFVLHRDRAWLAAHGGDVVDHPSLERFFALAKRRRDGEPVAYLVGRREFWGLDLIVEPTVLVPRPETETLVEAALARLPHDVPLRLLDLGTGSGAIALALARERPRSHVTAVDSSVPALGVARRNAERLVIANVTFLPADWYDGLPEDAGPFDAIVSNPPYVAPSDPHLRDPDLRYEPLQALVSGPDGLGALRTIVTGAPARLKPGGWLLLEHGYNQSESVQQIFASASFETPILLRDLAGIPRVAVARLR